MSIFDENIIQTLPDPQTYFEALCEKEFGFNLTEGSIYNRGYNPMSIRRILKTIEQKYPNKRIRCYKEGFGHLMLEVMPLSPPREFDLENPVLFEDDYEDMIDDITAKVNTDILKRIINI